MHEKAEVSQGPSDEDLMRKPKRAGQSEQLKFSFLQHCLFCGGKYDVAKDPMHLDRWCPTYVCIQAAASKRFMMTSTELNYTTFDLAINNLAEYQDIIHNSIDTVTEYVEEEGNTLSRRQSIP